MATLGDATTLVVIAVAAAVVFSRRSELIEAIENFKNNFPHGGPPAPMHPSPAADGAWLQRKAPKATDI